MVKNLPAMEDIQVQSLGQEDPLEKEMAIHLVFLPGEFHGRRSLVNYSPQGHKFEQFDYEMKSESESHSVMSNSLWPHEL